MSWKKHLSKHHRVPRALHGSNAASNISLVTVPQHRAFHQLFGVMTPEEIAKVLTEVWIDPKWKMVAVRK
jgi:hypothetical protein